MKKLMAILLAASLLVGTMSGCGGGGDSSAEDSDGGSSQTTEESGGAENGETADTGETYEIVMTWMNFGSGAPEGMPDVEAAINEIVGPELGVSISLLPVSASTMASEQTLMISAGDKLDLVISDIPTMVNNGSIIALDDLYEQYGTNLSSKFSELVQAGGYYGDTLYAIPQNYVMGQDYGFEGRKDIFDKYGFAPEEGKRYTLEELEAMFDVIKEGEGDNFYIFANITSTANLFQYMWPYHALTTTASTGALMFDYDQDDWSQFTTFENLYASDEYREYAELMYKWAQKGFISPDAGSNMDATETLMKSGNYLGQIYFITGDAVANFKSNTGYDIVAFPTQLPYSTGNTGIKWSITSTCENPEKTFQFLDYLYGDNDIDNMLQFGLEGVDYQVLESNEYGTVIDFPEGMDSTTVPYFQVAGIYGDRLSWFIKYPNDIMLNHDLKEFQESVTLKSPAIGYTFISDEYQTDITAIDAVVNQYQGIITSGAIDPEIELEEFNNALEAAGIDRVIQGNQEQFDAWLEEQ